jgi:hypothetical protein
MKKSIVITLFLGVLATPAFAQITTGGAIPKDTSQMRDDNHDIRPDRVDQRAVDKNMTANEAREAKHKAMMEYKAQQKALNEQNKSGVSDDGLQPRSAAAQAK